MQVAYTPQPSSHNPVTNGPGTFHLVEGWLVPGTSIGVAMV